MDIHRHDGDRSSRSPTHSGGETRRSATRSEVGLHQMLAFRGYGNADVIHIQGRVQRAGNETAYSGGRRAGGGGGERIALQIGAQRCTSALSPDGLYSATVPVPDDIESSDDGWQNVLVIADTGHGARTAHHRVLLPRQAPTVLLIWDLDRILIEAAGSHSLPGALTLCRGLVHGMDHPGNCPAFFLSSRGWHEYLALSYDMASCGLPEGPILLNPPPGLPRRVPGTDGKAAHLRQILNTYPDTPAVLIGSAGQLRTGPLRRALDELAGRLHAAYGLRGASDRRYETLPTPSWLTLSDDCRAIAQDACRRGLLSAPALRRVEADFERS